MNETYPGNEDIQGEIEQKTEEIQVLFDSLEKIKDRFTRKELGDEVVDRAESQIRFSKLGELSDIDHDDSLAKLGHEMLVEYVKDLLTLEPKDEVEENDLILIRQSLLPEFFPDQTELSIIDNNYLLGKLAKLLEITRTHSDLSINPEVENYFRWIKIFDFVLSRKYRAYFCSGNYVALNTSKLRISFTVPETEDQDIQSGSIAISLANEKLFLGDDEVTNAEQLYYVKKLLEPFKEIVCEAQATIENEDE